MKQGRNALGGYGQKMHLLREQLKVDFLPARTIEINILVAKKCGASGSRSEKSMKASCFRRPGQLVDQQNAIDLKRVVEGDQTRV